MVAWVTEVSVATVLLYGYSATAEGYIRATVEVLEVPCGCSGMFLVQMGQEHTQDSAKGPQSMHRNSSFRSATASETLRTCVEDGGSKSLKAVLS